MAACFSQEKFNVTSYDAMAFAITTIQAFAGLWINGFIVCVLCVARVNKKIFNSSEKILLVLGCCRFGESCFTWVYSFLTLIYAQCFYVHPMPQMFAAILSFFHSSNMWASASLCGFYCVKIANFQHTFFIYLKRKTDRMVPWLLFGSLLVSLSMAFVGYYTTDRDFKISSSTATKHLGILSFTRDGLIFLLFLISGFESSTAFIAAIFSALLLLSSLWRHKCRMQANSMRNLNVDAHIKAIKSILFFICIYSINFTGFLLLVFYFGKKEHLRMFFMSLFQHALPVAHSLVLIFSNPNLEKTLLRTLTCFKLRQG
ncbi:taste receptor type 2 member 40-like [Pogoniulus pusillus]|uniref:taste receptor type 2 member 40-like n=1 Tax=Pogoniulus pusillus TaxID=488313 RepID=UPI0030B97DBC